MRIRIENEAPVWARLYSPSRIVGSQSFCYNAFSFVRGSVCQLSQYCEVAID